LSAVVAWFGRSQSVFDQLLGVVADGADSAHVDQGEVPAT
jgi:hypothetical protein